MTGNHDVPRPASRYRLDEGFTPEMIVPLIALGDRNAKAGAQRARAAALVLLALPGSAYLYQGEELGLPEVTDIGEPPARTPVLPYSGRVPGPRRLPRAPPLAPAGPGFGFSRTEDGASPAAPWLPPPSWWGSYSVESQRADEHSFLNLYRAALRLRRDHPALGRGTLRWLGHDVPDLLCFARDPGFVLAVNFGPVPSASRPPRDPARQRPVAGDGALPPDTAVWLSA